MFTFDYKNNRSSALRAIICLILGLVLIFSPKAAVSILIVRVIGVVIVGLGVLEIIAVGGFVMLARGGFFTLALSILVVFFGATLIFSPFGDSVMALLAGIGLAYYGITDLLSSITVRQAAQEYEIKFERPQKPRDSRDGSDIKVSRDTIDSAREVDYEKIDEQ